MIRPWPMTLSGNGAIATTALKSERRAIEFASRGKNCLTLSS